MLLRRRKVIRYDARALEALESFLRELKEEKESIQMNLDEIEKKIEDVEDDIMEMEEDRIRPQDEDKEQ